METLETWRSFLGWCSLLNLGLLAFAGLFVMILRPWTTRIHGRIFGLGEEDLARAYFQYLAQYKIAIFVFNLVPYFALRIAA